MEDLRRKSLYQWPDVILTMAGTMELMAVESATESSNLPTMRNNQPFYFMILVLFDFSNCGVDTYETGMSWFTAMECCYFNKVC